MPCLEIMILDRVSRVKIHFNRLPHDKMNGFAIGRRVLAGNRPTRYLEPPLRDEAWQLITECWGQEPGNRPGIDDILETMVSWSSRLRDRGTPSTFKAGIFSLA